MLRLTLKHKFQRYIRIQQSEALRQSCVPPTKCRKNCLATIRPRQRRHLPLSHFHWLFPLFAKPCLETEIHVRKAGKQSKSFSTRQPAMQRRCVQRSKPVMPQPAQIAVKECTKIRNAVFQHRDPVDAHAKGKALPFVGVNPASRNTLGEPCRSPALEPIVALADCATCRLPMNSWISTSAEGSVNGKCDARKRVSTPSTQSTRQRTLPASI